MSLKSGLYFTSPGPGVAGSLGNESTALVSMLNLTTCQHVAQSSCQASQGMRLIIIANCLHPDQAVVPMGFHLQGCGISDGAAERCLEYFEHCDLLKGL